MVSEASANDINLPIVIDRAYSDECTAFDNFYKLFSSRKRPRMNTEIQEIENVCVLFQYATPQTIKDIQDQLSQFFSTSLTTRQQLHKSLQNTLSLLSYSKREIVHSLCISHLKSLLATHHSLFLLQDLQALQEQISHFQINAMIITLGWTLSDSFQTLVKELITNNQFQMISAIIQEINPETSCIKHFNRHRRTAVSFRDTVLFDVFQSAIRVFKGTNGRTMSPSGLNEHVLMVIHQCLGFDFLGYQSDQDGHGMTSATQIPNNWKSVLVEEKLVFCFGSLLSAGGSTLLFEVLGYLVATRRSLFNDQERIEFVDTSCQVLTKLASLPLESTSDLLKVILKFTAVYSTDLKKCDSAPLFIESMLRYTKEQVQSVGCYDFLFFAQIWSFIRDSEHTVFVEQLEQFQELILMFVNIDRELLEALYFDDPTTLEQVLVPVGRIMGLMGFSYSIQVILSRLNSFASQTDAQSRVETAWTISLFSGMLSHRISYQASSDDDRNDGVASGTIFRFVEFKSFQNIADSCDELLELSILGFFDQFKQTYLTGDGSNCPITWQAIVANSPVTCQGDVLLLYLQRVLSFLKESNSEPLVLKAAGLFQELVNGVHTCKLLQTSNLLQFIDESGIFGLFIHCSYGKSKVIMKLFESIGRLFFSHQFNESPERNLKRLLAPISEYLESYSQTGNDLQQMDLVIRKLRGILSSIYTSKLYQCFFDWIRPWFPLIKAFLASEACIYGPANTLRLIRDIATNKVNRLSFDIASEYGVLMFREVMDIVATETVKLDAILNQDISEPVWIKSCLKPMTIILDTLQCAICSKAVPFGILRLYEDSSMLQLVQVGFMLSSAVTYVQLSEYQKLSTAYFGFWVQMTSDWMTYLCPSITSDSFERLAFNAMKILDSLDNAVSSQACTIINSIFTHLFERQDFFGVNTTIQRKQLIQVLVSRIFTTDLETQWSFTRPLLPLILCDTDWFGQYLKTLISIQAPPLEPYEKLFFGLLDGCDGTLSVKNRDSFTRNVDAAKRTLQTEPLGFNFDLPGSPQN